MPKIHYYILSEGDATTRFQFACRLIEKAYRNQHSIYVHTENESDAHQLDELLWTYRVDSFLPHNLYGEGPEPPPPIQIGFNNDLNSIKHRDILINLSYTIPVFHKQFNRILEIVPQDTDLQNRLRENYRIYRASGYDISTHKLQLAEL